MHAKVIYIYIYTKNKILTFIQVVVAIKQRLKPQIIVRCVRLLKIFKI